jgi:hypothetical protein
VVLLSIFIVIYSLCYTLSICEKQRQAITFGYVACRTNNIQQSRLMLNQYQDGILGSMSLDRAGSMVRRSDGMVAAREYTTSVELPIGKLVGLGGVLCHHAKPVHENKELRIAQVGYARLEELQCLRRGGGAYAYVRTRNYDTATFRSFTVRLEATVQSEVLACAYVIQERV